MLRLQVLAGRRGTDGTMLVFWPGGAVLYETRTAWLPGLGRVLVLAEVAEGKGT